MYVFAMKFSITYMRYIRVIMSVELWISCELTRSSLEFFLEYSRVLPGQMPDPFPHPCENPV